MKPFQHQTDGIQTGRDKNLLYQWDCGTGKTYLGLNLIKDHLQDGFGPALVVCPLSIIDAAWREDAAKFTPELSIVSLHDKNPAKRKKRLAEKHDIFVANFETFKTLYDDIRAKRFGVIIVDESSKMKNYKSQITKALLSLAGVGYRTKGGKGYPTDQVIPWRYCLSGTPAPNNEAEYWPQVLFVTGKTRPVFPVNYYAFRGMYFYNVFANAQNTLAQDWQIRKDMSDDFNDQIKSVSHVVRKEDAVDLPDQIFETRHVTLSAPEQAAYDTMKKDLMLEFGSDVVLAANAMTKIMKLRQITSGFCYGDDGKTFPIGRSKFNELTDLLAEIGNKQVIIWANFRQEIAELMRMLPDSAVLWSETDDRTQAITDFQSGKCRYLIANPMSAAHGLTFVNCNYAVYFSLNYSYEMQKQSEDRIHRIGQNKKCTYYSLVARGTVDELINQAVAKKANMNQTILNHLRGNNDGTPLAHGRKAI